MVERIESGWELQQRFIAFKRDYYTPDAYDFMLNYYDELDENMEVDVIAICGDWAEYELEELVERYYDDNEIIEWVQENMDEYEETSDDEVKKAIDDGKIDLQECFESFADTICSTHEVYELEDVNYLASDI